MPNFSTRYKIAVGYILLTLMLITTMGYVYRIMRTMSNKGDVYELLSVRRGYVNEIINDLNKAEIIVAKNRHGECKTLPLYWDGQFTRFTSQATGYEEHYQVHLRCSVSLSLMLMFMRGCRKARRASQAPDLRAGEPRG